MNDKTKHFIVGAALGVASYFTSWGWGLLASTLIFVGKEYYDTVKKNPTGFDKRDLLADYMGLFIGYVIVFTIKWIINVSNL